MNEPLTRTFLSKAIANLKDVWRGIADSGYSAETASLRPELPDGDLDRVRRQMRECLESRGGEVSARARAAALGRAYLALDATGRKRFLTVMAEDFEPDPAAIDEAIRALRTATDRRAQQDARAALRQVLESPRLRLLTQFNALPEGVKFLVDMRAEILSFLPQEPTLAPLERDLKGLLATWFDIGFLELKRIAWDSAPATLLEKLIAYEAVHAIGGWEDLKNRLDSDRRCFAFFHPRMPSEPLIFVEVALTHGLADNVGELLDKSAPVQNPRDADTAIFYSISNAQKGLAGISFGGFLIKRVADSLSAEFKGLKTFATLSPVPGFLAWLEGVKGDEGTALLLPEEIARMTEAGIAAETSAALANALRGKDWVSDPARVEALREPLLRLCARYLAREKAGAKRALDPVAHFHLTNGARLERINWLADTSAKGLAQSAGIMVNYLYRLGDIEDNHEAYSDRGEVRVSASVRGSLKS
ncbi:MAG: malonyl-CoA decarboxylase [Alphaproteobacteria bacterium]|nr:malonyl-CoA decarboxylase [Alphaproteobacteria bacterium]